MKKLGITVAVLACVTSMVSAETVTSANIVGYSKSDIDAGMVEIMAPQFFQSSTNGITLGEAFEGLEDLSKAYAWTGDDGYAIYTFFGGDWYLGSTISNDFLIESGTAIWIQGAGTMATAMISGEVPDAEEINVPVVAGVNLIANPYPTVLTLGELVVSNLDVLHVWGGGYTSYTFYDGVWYNGSTASNDVEIPVGIGFWLESSTAGTLTFTKKF